MLERYYVKNDPEIVPYTDGKYNISQWGYLTDLDIGKQIYPEENGSVILRIMGKDRKVNLKWILAATFKPVYAGESFLESLIEKWQVLVIDPERPLHPGNLIWKPPEGGQECPDLPGYYVIPGFTRYVIDREGRVIIRRNGPRTSVRKNKPDRYLTDKAVGSKFQVRYRGFDIRADDDYYTTLGTHRLLALTFLEYDNCVDSVTVNHIDGNKSNNRISNLEWATYSENAAHSYTSGLRPVVGNRPVEVMDLWTNKSVTFPSITSVRKSLNYGNNGTINGIIKGKNVSRNRYAMRWLGDTSPWPVVTISRLKEADLAERKRVRELECWAMNIKTRELVIGNTPQDIVRHFGIDRNAVWGLLMAKIKYPKYGIMAGYLKDGKPCVRDYSDDEIAAYMDQTAIRNAYRVYRAAGGTVVTVKIPQLAKELSCSVKVVSTNLKGVTATNPWCYKGNRVFLVEP